MTHVCVLVSLHPKKRRRSTERWTIDIVCLCSPILPPLLESLSVFATLVQELEIEIVGYNKTITLNARCPVEHTFMLWSIWLMESITEGFQISALLFLHWAHILMRCFFPSFFQIRLNREKTSQKLGIFFFFFFFLFLVVSSLTCTLKKSCHFTLPKFHLFPFLPFINSNLPLKHWLLFSCFSLLFFSPSDSIAQEKGKSIFFCLFLALVSSVTCTLKKNCHFMLPKFHLLLFLLLIHTNLPLKHWLLFNCFSFFSSSDNIALEKGKSIFFRLFLVLV